MPRERFERIVGASNTLYKPLDLEAYAYDASGAEMLPGFVLFPNKVEQLHKIILYCNRIKRCFVVRGRGSGHQGGCLGDGVVIIDMSRFNQVSTIENDIISVGAGVTVKQLQEHLVRQKKMLPWSFGYASTMSVGGLVSINPYHKYSLRNGKVIEDVVEMTVLDATGKLYTLREKDMQIYAGTEGRLGIIISLKLRVVGLKEYIVEVVQFSTMSKMLEEVESLRADDDVVAIEFLDKKTSLMCDLGEQYTLLYETTTLTKKQKVRDKILIRKIVKARDKISSLLKSSGYIYEEDSFVSPQKIKDLLVYFEGVEKPCYGHISVGVLHSNYRRDEDCVSLYAAIGRLGGQCGAQFGYGLLKAKYTPIRIRNMIKRLLPTHNPHDFLNPGKMIRDVPEDGSQ